MAQRHDETESTSSGQKRQERRNVLYGVVMFAAIALFVAIGGQVGAQAVRTFLGYSEGTDQIMVTALLLNIALILLTWRRTNALSDEIHVYRAAEVRAQHLAMTDPLTNLFNRRAIKEKTTELSARASRRWSRATTACSNARWTGPRRARP